MDVDIKEILEYVERNSKIPLRVLEKWMKSDNIEVIGAVYRIFDQLNNLIEITPDLETTILFYINYFRRCIIENPVGEYPESRYIAAISLARFYKAIRRDKGVPAIYVKLIIEMIATIYKSGDKDVRQAIVNGTLEHLFEDDIILSDFVDWKHDEELLAAYNEALEWTSGNAGGVR